MDKKQRVQDGFRIDAVDKRSDGSLRISGRLTKTGVFEYQRGDETIRELRSDAEVFSESALDSLKGSPVTVDHPRDFVSTDNFKELAVGYVTDVTVNPPYVEGGMQIWDSHAIHMIERGYLKEVSCGYLCAPVPVQSEYADVAQTALEFNHAALGPEGWGRLGSDVSLRLDSNDQAVIEPFNSGEVMSEETLAPILEAIQRLEEKTDARLSELEAKTATPEPNSDSAPPVKKFEELPAQEQVAALVAQRVDHVLKLEVAARSAYQTFFPGDWIEDVPCGRKLVEAVLQTVDSDRVVTEDEDIEPLVREAQLLAKKERMDRDQKRQSVQSIKQQLTGVPAHVLQTPKSGVRAHFSSGIRDHIFGNNEG